jgi:hypothetical protein
MQELADRAVELGANAVVGFDIDYEALGQNNGMLMVSVSGTAVILGRPSSPSSHPTNIPRFLGRPKGTATIVAGVRDRFSKT